MIAEESAGRLCPYCGDVLGVYEPIVLLHADHAPRETSLLAETGLLPGTSVLHAACYNELAHPD